MFYGRVSSPEQDKDKGSDKKTSREMQTESPDRWLAYNKLPPLRDEDVFFDTATGTNAERPELERLMREVKQGLISVVLVWKIDRFGRNVRDFLNLLYELEEYKVNFCSITENLDTSNEMGKATAKIMMTVYSVFSEMETTTRRDRMLGGRMKKVERDGNWIGGTPPFGYKLVAHKLAAVPEGAEIVVFIYNAYLEFKSISRVVLEAKKEFVRRNIGTVAKRDLENTFSNGREIFDWLIEKGYLSKIDESTGYLDAITDGLIKDLRETYEADSEKILSILQQSVPPIKLDGRQIGRMLKNRLYTGESYSKKHDKIMSEKKHDAIIEIEKFNRVQILLKTNYQGHATAWSKRSPGFLFRDRAVCGHCESCMVAHHAPVHLRYYSCHLRRKEGAKACVHKKNHRHDKFDENNLVTVIEHLKLIISQPGYLEEKMSLISIKEMEALKKHIRDKRIHLSKIEEYKEDWRRGFEAKEIEALEMTARIKGFERDTFRIGHEIVELEAQIEDVLRKRIDVNKAKQLAREFEKNFECANEEQRRDMINAVVKQVRVFNDTHTEFDFNF